MAVLSELAQSKQMTQVGSIASGRDTVGSSTNVQASQIDDRKTQLIKDLLGSTSNIIKEQVRATEYTSKKIASTNYNEFAKQIRLNDEQYDDKYFTPYKKDENGNLVPDESKRVALTDELIEKKREYEYNLYKTYSEKDTSPEYKELFGYPAASLLHDYIKKNNSQKSEILYKKNEKNLEESINNSIAANFDNPDKLAADMPIIIESAKNINLTPSQTYMKILSSYKSMVENVLSNKNSFVTKNGVLKEDYINKVKASGINIIDKINSTIDGSNRTQEEKEASKKIISQEANSLIGAFDSKVEAYRKQQNASFYGELDEYANSMFSDTEFVDDNGVNHYFEKDFKSYQENIISKAGKDWNSLSKEQQTALFNKFDQKQKSSEANENYIATLIANDYDTYYTKPVKANKQPDIAAIADLDRRVTNALGMSSISTEKKISLLKIQEDTQRIKGDNEIALKTVYSFLNGNTRSIDDFIKTGFRKEDGTVINGETFKFAIQDYIGKYSDALNNIDMSADPVAATTEFKDIAKKIYKLEEALTGSSNPEALKRFHNVINSPEAIMNLDINGIKQFVAYAEYKTENMSDNDEFRISYRNKISSIKQMMNSFDLAVANADDANKQAVAKKELNTLKNAISTAGNWNVSNSVLAKRFKDSIEEKIGKDWIDTGVPDETSYVMMELYTGHGSDYDIGEFVKKFDYIDISERGVFSDIFGDRERIILPRNVTRSDWRATVKKILKQNNVTEDEIDYEPEVFTTSGKFKSKALGYKVKKNGTVLGRINIESINK